MVNIYVYTIYSELWYLCIGRIGGEKSIQRVFLEKKLYKTISDQQLYWFLRYI